MQFGQRHGRIGSNNPQELDGTFLGEPENVHGVRRGGPAWELFCLDIPDARQLVHVPGILPVAEAGEISVAAGFARVLRGRLAVGLNHAAARLADHAANQHQVIDLARGGRRLAGLVKALQHRADEPLRAAQHPCGLV